MADAAVAKASALDVLAAVEAKVAELRTALEAIEVGPPTRTVAASWGDGVKDATAAIQIEIDALAPTGGVCKVPAGTYMIDALKTVWVRSGVTLELDPAATLKVKPNGAERYYLLRLEADAVAKGGKLLGDRLAHTYSTDSTHEWGYGVMLSTDRCKLLDMEIAEFTGDGIGLSGDDVEIRNVVSTRNRRQGMSVFTAKRARIYDSTFSHTGALGSNPGALPKAGVDIEPDGASSGANPLCEDIQFVRCKFLDNEAAGAKTYKDSAKPVPAIIRGISFVDCEMAGNGSDGGWFSYCEGLTLDRCYIHENQGYGVMLLLTTTTTKPAESNTFHRNLLRSSTLDRNPVLSASGFPTEVARDLKKQDTAGVCAAGVNTYR